MMTGLRTNFYIDGFNFYYGAVKGTPYKWLDFSKFFQLALPKNRIHKIKYFTAMVVPRPHDPDQAVRQQTYLRALGTIPNLSIVFGHFLTSRVWMPLTAGPNNGCLLTGPATGACKSVQVVKTEEKGSDVNLATHLLIDGYKKDYDVAVVVSNDSDLVEPIRIVQQELKIPIGVINPHTRKPSVQLKRQASFRVDVRKKHLAASLFPSIMTDALGTFNKPP